VIRQVPTDSFSETEVMGRLGLLGVIERVGRFGIATQDLQHGGIVCSTGLLDLLALRDSAPLRGIEEIEPLIHPLDRSLFRSLLTPVGPSGQFGVHGEVRIIRSDGLMRWVRITFELKHDDAGEPSHLVHLVFDTSAARAAQERASDAIRHRKELAHAIGFVSWAFPAGGPIPEAPLWTELTGQSLQESSGDGWLNAIHPDDRSATEHAWRTAMEQGTAYSAAYRLRLRSGDYRWFVARSGPVFGPDGRLDRWVGACVDADELGNRIMEDRAPQNLRIAGHHLRAARGLLNWSVRELATQSHVTPAMVRRMEEARLLDPSDPSWERVRMAVEIGGAAFVSLPDGAVAVAKRARRGQSASEPKVAP
jgi:PAS domain S-box-containing protein